MVATYLGFVFIKEMMDSLLTLEGLEEEMSNN